MYSTVLKCTVYYLWKASTLTVSISQYRIITETLLNYHYESKQQ